MLQYCISEMERRYVLLDALGARDIRVYNRKAKKQRVSRLPYIVVVIDEFADLMATTGKELESTLARLAAMARAIGIHLVLATQRPSIDVITGLIKANIPSRIAFMVANKFDSRIIVDGVGAEKLLGRGDMLFSAAWNPFPVRIQGAFVDDEEIDAITAHLKKKYGEPQYIDDEVFFEDEEAGDFEGEAGNDPLFERALEIVVSQGKASASYIQRRLKIGYNRSARLVEEMEQRGIVGPAQGSKPREIIHIPKGSP
jgi:S-DNA-T family DNA segregation ATPase FtsK/SpoIIIE